MPVGALIPNLNDRTPITATTNDVYYKKDFFIPIHIYYRTAHVVYTAVRKKMASGTNNAPLNE
jgi:hypothetical protein